ncbi:MAG: hypothetical protein WC971_06165 [Coriobacteriia bacterium]
MTSADILGVLALVFAAGLLVSVLALQRVSEGSMIAENMTYVLAGVVCLAASVLVGWVARFLPLGLSSEMAEMGSDGLIIVSMACLAVYFYLVRRSMVLFMRAARGEAGTDG